MIATVLTSALLLTGVPTIPFSQQRPVEVAERAADNPDKVICKRFLRTGSLVDGYRECKTKAGWERERANIRMQAASSDGCRARAEPDPLKAGGGCGF